VADDRADVAGRQKTVDAVPRRAQDRLDGRRHEYVRDENAEVGDALLRGLPDGHGVGRGGRLEADGEKDDLLVRVGLRDFERVQRRVDDAYVAAARFGRQQIAARARYAEHVAERREDDVRLRG